MPPLPQSGVGFPNIPGVTYTGLKTTRYLLDYGPDFYDDRAFATINPPVITPPYQDNPANGPIYPSFVPKTDSDGNDIAGVRLPDVTRAARDLHRLGAARGSAGERRLRELRANTSRSRRPRPSAWRPAIRGRRSRSAIRRSASTTAR